MVFETNNVSIDIEAPPLPALRKGYPDLKISVELDGERVRSAEIMVRYVQRKTSVKRLKGDAIVLYAICYGKHLKIGSSTKPSVVARMASQAPLGGVVLAELILSRDLRYIDEVEDKVREKLVESRVLNKYVITTSKPRLEVIKKTWLSYGRKSYTDNICKLLNQDSIRSDIIGVLVEYGDLTYVFDNYCFTTRDLEQTQRELLVKAQPLTKTVAYNLFKDFVLTKAVFFENGLVTLDLNGATYFTTLDKLIYEYQIAYLI